MGLSEAENASKLVGEELNPQEVEQNENIKKQLMQEKVAEFPYKA